MRKRLFDLVIAVPALVVLSPLIAVAVVVATIDTRQFGIFSQTRIGRHGEPFTIYKVRTMRGAGQSTITTDRDTRITTVGRWMRRLKLDELPQLWNVVNGSMSLVGPRPDVPGYADRLTGSDRRILDLRPGMTGPASLYFRNEQTLLAGVANSRLINDQILWPLKVRINSAYHQSGSLADDLRLVVLSIRPNEQALLEMMHRWNPELSTAVSHSYRDLPSGVDRSAP